MSAAQQTDIICMFREGKFSIKEVAAYAGVSEFAAADYLISIGALRRKERKK